MSVLPGADENLSISFSISREDYWALNEFVQDERFKRRKLIALIAVLSLAAFALLVLLSVLQGGIGWLLENRVVLGLLGAISVLVVLLFAMRRFIRRMVMNLPDDDGVILGPKTMRFTSEGLVSESKTATTTLSWKGMRRLAQTDAHYFLFIERYQAYIIPRRAFGSVAEDDAFRAFVSSFLESHGRIQSAHGA